MFWVYGGGFIMGDASEENYLPGPLLDTREVWKFFEINQNKQIIDIFYLFKSVSISLVKQSVTTEENDPHSDCCRNRRVIFRFQISPL